MDEMVLVIEEKDAEKVFKDYGFLDVPLEIIKELTEKRGFFVRRGKAEMDESIRQLIPYVIVRNEKGLYLLVKRLKAQTESRLHGFYSIGIGGHVNDKDEGHSPWLKFLSGMEREVDEEISVENYNWPKYLGLIRENSTSVNRVHLGVVFTITAKVNGVKEIDKFSWEMVSLNGLREKYEEMELWSKLALDALEEKVKE